MRQRAQESTHLMGSSWVTFYSLGGHAWQGWGRKQGMDEWLGWISIPESACEQFQMSCWDGWTLFQNYGWRGWGVIRPVIKKKNTNQTKSYSRSWGEDNTEGFASATGEAMCHFPPWTGPHFSGFGIPREWKMNRTIIPMGLSCLILHAIWNSSPTAKCLHFKEKLQSYIKMAGYTRDCRELVN